MFDLYCFVRKNIGAVLIGGAALSVAFVPSDYTTYTIAAWGVFAACLVVGAQVRTIAVSRKFGGRMLEFVFAPTPLGSLIENLAKQGVKAESVKTVDLMSADLGESLHYYENGDGNGSESFLSTLKRCPDIEVTVFGNSATLVDSDERIKIIQTEKRYVEHTNLITTRDGRNFVWYEPYHNVINHKHYFGRGAYLFEVDDKTASAVKHQLQSLPRAA